MHLTHGDPFRSTTHARLAADEVGRSDDDRPAIVLLHGLTFDRRMWQPALAELVSVEPGRRAIAFDLPGHGDSPDASSYSPAMIVHQVHAALVEAGIESPLLVGHSASASTVAMYATQFPTSGFIAVEGTFVVRPFAELVQSLEPILRGPGFPAAWARISDSVFRLDEVAPDVRDFVRTTSRARQEVVLGYWQGLFDQSPAALTTSIASGAAMIRRSGIPVTLVVGSEPSAPERAWLEANLRDARTMVWSRSGHFPHLAHPHRFAELMASTSISAAPALTPTLR